MGDLAAAIRAEPAAEFATLDDAERSALADAVERAAHERSVKIDRAINDSLRYMPAMLRGVVKRALGM